MKIQTQDLIGPALDWAVAYAISSAAANDSPHAQADMAVKKGLSYSTRWDLGGWLIEREEIELRKIRQKGAIVWEAWDDSDAAGLAQGPTRLVAAMRCIVAARVGSSVEVPDVVAAMSQGARAGIADTDGCVHVDDCELEVEAAHAQDPARPRAG